MLPMSGISAGFLFASWAAISAYMLSQDGLKPIMGLLRELMRPTGALARMGLARVVALRLARAANRSGELAAQAALLRVPLEFVAAADGFDPEFRSRVLPSWVPEATCADFVGATFASHERAWALAAEETAPVLILEDDARLPPSFVRSMAERMEALPKDFDVALAGSSLSPRARSVSFADPRLLSKPDGSDASEKSTAFRGLWAYVVSPHGARRLLQLASEERGCGEVGQRGRRLFLPVDHFVARRVQRLSVLALEPPPELAAEFAMHRSDQHISASYRQVGVVRVASLPSLSLAGEEDHPEAIEMRKAWERITALGSPNRWTTAQTSARVTVESEAAFRRMRAYSCRGATQMLRHAGLALLQLVWQDVERARDVAEAKRMLLLALEALSSALRYDEGLGTATQLRRDLLRRVKRALRQREEAGLPPVDPPLKRELVGVGWISVKSLGLVEWLPQRTSADGSQDANVESPACGLEVSQTGVN